MEPQRPDMPTRPAPPSGPAFAGTSNMRYLVAGSLILGFAILAAALFGHL